MKLKSDMLMKREAINWKETKMKVFQIDSKTDVDSIYFLGYSKTTGEIWIYDNDSDVYKAIVVSNETEVKDRLKEIVHILEDSENVDEEIYNKFRCENVGELNEFMENLSSVGKKDFKKYNRLIFCGDTYGYVENSKDSTEE